jgi:hypothetical protein
MQVLAKARPKVLSKKVPWQALRHSEAEMTAAGPA